MKNYRRIAMLMCSVGLMFLLTGVTYSFFNYTKTGTANSFETGTINFSVDDGESISLTNVFPMTASEASEANIDTLTIGISGNTTYSSGEEFLISIVDVTKINNKEIPISYIATYTPTTGNSIGTEEDDYFTERESKSTNIYLLNENGWVKEDKQVLVGFIKGGTAGIDGTLTIKPYVDEERIAITDTPEENPEWVAGRTVFSTTEWNSLQGNNAISFKIKAESYTKLWVEEPEADNVTPEICFNKQLVKVYTLNTNMTQTELNDCISYFNGLDLSYDDGTAEDYCLGTGRYSVRTFQVNLDNSVVTNGYDSEYPYDYDYLLEHNIIISEDAIQVLDYDDNCGSNIVFPSKMSYAKPLVNTNMTQTELTSCANYFSNWSLDSSNGETIENFCNGTGTMWGKTFQKMIDYNSFSQDDLDDLSNINAIVEEEEKKYPVYVIGKSGESILPYSILRAPSLITFNSNLKMIGGEAFWGVHVPAYYNKMIVPQSVRFIGYHSLVFNLENNADFEMDVQGKPFIDARAFNDYNIIRYGGTCQELYDNSSSYFYANKAYIIYGSVRHQAHDVITTDTNTCTVYEDSD